MKKLLVICGAGMTSSILVSRMRSYVSERGNLDYKIGSCAVNQTEKYIPQSDIVFVAPHLSYLTEEIRRKYPEIRVVEIPSDLYAKVDGEKVLGLLETEEQDRRKKTMTSVIASFFAHAGYIRSLSEASYSLMPVLITGSLFMILQNFPVSGYQEMIAGTWVSVLCTICTQFSMNAVSLYMTFLIAYHYGGRSGVSAPHAGMNSLVCFFLLMNISGNEIDLSYFGTKGLFCAMLTAFVSVRVYVRLKDFSDRIGRNLRSVPQGIYDSFMSIIPGFVCVVLFLAAAALFKNTPYGSFPDFVYLIIQEKLSSILKNSLSSFVFMNVLTNLLWFIGIHGGQIVRSVSDPLYLPMTMENLAAYAAGSPLPNIIHKQFSYAFVFGGAGSTLSLAVLMFFLAKSEHMKSLGRVSLPMGIFFINEPIILGLPIMMNPLMLAPFVLIPALSGCLTYFAMSVGFIPYSIGFEIPWTTPILISGMLQGGWKLALWQAVMFFLQMAAWYPFFKIQDKHYAEEELSDSVPHVTAENRKNFSDGV